MIRDKLLLMSNEQAVTASAASTDVIDTLAAGNAISPGARFRALTKVAATDASSDATLTVELQTSVDEAFTSPISLFSTGALAFASFSPAKTVLADLVIPKGVKRYLRAYYTVASGPLTAGKFDAEIVLDSATTLDKNL